MTMKLRPKLPADILVAIKLRLKFDISCLEFMMIKVMDSNTSSYHIKFTKFSDFKNKYSKIRQNIKIVTQTQ